MRIFKQLNDAGLKLPALGQGMGEYSWSEDQVNILRHGVDLGMNFIDTAEGYDNGHSEEFVGKAASGIRGKVIIGTKFSPENSSYDGVLKSAEGSLRRLNTDYLDLYQMHWPNPAFPFEESLLALSKLVKEGKARYIGLGNIYLKKLKKAVSFLGEKTIASIQVEYNLFDRTIEDELIPYCQDKKILIIAYTPIDHGRVADGKVRRAVLDSIAVKYEKSPAEIALRWLVDKSPVIGIPKVSSLRHLKENSAAADFDLDKQDIDTIDKVFENKIVFIEPIRIKVTQEGEGGKKIYQTLQEAKKNRLGFVPSPVDLARDLEDDDHIKPVRLVKKSNRGGFHHYDLVEGRIRYWAWVIARSNTPIPALIREDWPS